MRIAYLAKPRSMNGLYRGIWPMRALQAYRGHRVTPIDPEGRRSPSIAEVPDIDLLFVHRYSEEVAQRLAREAKARGAVVVWDNDDAVLDIPKAAPTYRNWAGFAGERHRAEMRRMFRLADLVTTPSSVLADQWRTLGASHVQVVENFIADHFTETPRREHSGLTIGWVAGLEHQVDVERIPIRAALEQLLGERPDVNVVSIGLGLGLGGDRYRHVVHVPLAELCHEIAGFDIGIAPLVDIPFNRARSNVKLKEYAGVGVPWLASPVEPYAWMGERQGGRLIPDDGWHPALRRLLDKSRERLKLGKQAAKWARGETLSQRVGAWEDALASVVPARLRS